MYKLNRVLIGMIIVLFVFIIIEIVYFQKTPLLGNISTSTPTPTIRPQAAKCWNDPKNIDWIYQGINPNHAIDGKTIYSLSYYNKDVLTSSVLTNIHKGVITQLDAKGGKAFFDYYDYVVLLKIGTSQQSKTTDTFYLSAEDIVKTKIVNEKGKKLTLAELKVGDRVQVVNMINMLTSLPLPSPKFGEYRSKSWGYNTVQMTITKLD